MKKKVALFVFNSFINDSRVLKEALSLSSSNYYTVEVIAHLDKNLRSREHNKNFIIKRFSYLDRTVTKNKFKKLKAYFIYIKESVAYCQNFDILHCNDLNTLPIAFIIKRFFNKDIKVVYDAHEYETETNGLQGIQKIVIQKLEKFFIKYVDKIITVSNAIAEDYVKLYGIQKPALVFNTPDYVKITQKNLFRELLNIDKNKTIFLYQGSLNCGRGIEVLIETFKNIEDDENILVFMGYGPMEQEVREASIKYDSIYFHTEVQPDVLLDYTSSADFGISIIEDTCLSYRYCLPNKMFEYIMAEVPIIVSNLPEMKKIVEKYKIGMVVQDMSACTLIETIKDIKNMNKIELEANLQHIKKFYNWKNQEKVLLKVYREISE